MKPETQPNYRYSDQCPICNAHSEQLFRKNEYSIRDCIACGHRFAYPVHPEGHTYRVYADGYFRGESGGYADYIRDGDLLRSHGRNYARLINRYVRPGSVLDVGAAAGFVLKGFEDMGWHGIGIEPNPAMAKHARSRLGVEVLIGMLENIQLNNAYDLVAMIQVVPHFLDPRRAFEVANKLTKPGGYWLIETWNRDSWTARIFGEGWHEYNPPSVLHWFSISTLKDLANGFGFEEVARGRPTKWISSAYARSIAQRDLGSGLIKTLILGGTKLIPAGFRFPYILDDVFWALYQKPEAKTL